MISHWLGWFSLGICALLALKCMARKLKISTLNLFFRRIHIPLGVALLIIGPLHGVISFAKASHRTVPIITGIGAILLIYSIGVTYFFRKKLKKKWMRFHRVGTALLLPAVLLHLLFSLMQ